MSVREILALIVTTTLFFTALGGSIGFALGKFLPGYYRSVLRNGSAPEFDPLAVGIGQGLTQGMTGGAIVGVLLVFLLGRHRSKAVNATITTSALAKSPDNKISSLVLICLLSASPLIAWAALDIWMGVMWVNSSLEIQRNPPRVHQPLASPSATSPQT